MENALARTDINRFRKKRNYKIRFFTANQTQIIIMIPGKFQVNKKKKSTKFLSKVPIYNFIKL